MKRSVILILALLLATVAGAQIKKNRAVLYRPIGGMGPGCGAYEVCWDTDKMASVQEVTVSSFMAANPVTLAYDGDEGDTHWRAGFAAGAGDSLEAYVEDNNPWKDSQWPWINIEFTSAFRLGAVRVKLSEADSTQRRPDQIAVYMTNGSDPWRYCGHWKWSVAQLDTCEVLELVPQYGYNEYGDFLKLQFINHGHEHTEISNIEVFATARAGSCP